VPLYIETKFRVACIGINVTFIFTYLTTYKGNANKKKSMTFSFDAIGANPSIGPQHSGLSKKFIKVQFY
jgi:hypothetical protein